MTTRKARTTAKAKARAQGIKGRFALEMLHCMLREVIGVRRFCEQNDHFYGQGNQNGVTFAS
jgi:hypothetical protein